MRILEETKDYVIYYDLGVSHGWLSGIPSSLHIKSILLDKNTQKEYCEFFKISKSWNNLNDKNIIFLGKKLIKRWKKEK